MLAPVPVADAPGAPLASPPPVPAPSVRELQGPRGFQIPVIQSVSCHSRQEADIAPRRRGVAERPRPPVLPRDLLSQAVQQDSSSWPLPPSSGAASGGTRTKAIQVVKIITGQPTRTSLALCEAVNAFNVHKRPGRRAARFTKKNKTGCPTEFQLQINKKHIFVQVCPM